MELTQQGTQPRWSEVRGGLGADNTLRLHVADTLGVSLAIDLAALGLPQNRMIVEDLGIDQATFNVQALDPVNGKLQLSLSAGADRLTIYPGQVPLPMATVTLQEGVNGYSGAPDTYVSEWYPSNIYGGSDLIKVRSPNTFNGLLRFDLSSLPLQVLAAGVRDANVERPCAVQRQRQPFLYPGLPAQPVLGRRPGHLAAAMEPARRECRAQ